MIYTLKNKNFTVKVNGLGAELWSIKSNITNHEYLWQGREDLWKNHSTVLFPICGRLNGGKYTYKGKTYDMVLHGIAKLSEFEPELISDEKIVLKLVSNDETKKSYPFNFIFKMTYSLQENSIKESFEVINKEEKDLPFSLGGHPGFNVPFIEGENFEDYYIEFPVSKSLEKIVTNDNVLFTGKKEKFELENGKILRLKHNLFDNDAIFLCNMCDNLELKSTKNNRSIKVEYNDMTHVGFWHSRYKQAPFICIEPWHGIPAYENKIDDFDTKNEFIHLKKDCTYNTFIKITINE